MNIEVHVFYRTKYLIKQSIYFSYTLFRILVEKSVSEIKFHFSIYKKRKINIISIPKMHEIHYDVTIRTRILTRFHKSF